MLHVYRIFQGEEGSVCYNLHRPVYAFGLDDLLVKAKTKMKCTQAYCEVVAPASITCEQRWSNNLFFGVNREILNPPARTFDL